MISKEVSRARALSLIPAHPRPTRVRLLECRECVRQPKTAYPLTRQIQSLADSIREVGILQPNRGSPSVTIAYSWYGSSSAAAKVSVSHRFPSLRDPRRRPLREALIENIPRQDSALSS